MMLVLLAVAHGTYASNPRRDHFLNSRALPVAQRRLTWPVSEISYRDMWTHQLPISYAMMPSDSSPGTRFRFRRCTIDIPRLAPGRIPSASAPPPHFPQLGYISSHFTTLLGED